MAAVKIAGAKQPPAFGVDQRIIVGGIDFAFEQPPRIFERLPNRSQPLRRAAQRVAALPRGIARCFAANQMLANILGNGDLAGMALGFLHPGGEGLSAGFQRFDRERDRRQQRPQHTARVHPDECRDRRHHGGAVDQRQAFFGSEAERLQVRQLERLERPPCDGPRYSTPPIPTSTRAM